jgi:hypothetical protein
MHNIVTVRSRVSIGSCWKPGSLCNNVGVQAELEEALRSLELSVAGSAPVDSERERTYQVP